MKKILIFLFLILPSFLMAENAMNYKVSDIKVNVTDKDATSARQNAILQGQREAFDIVLERLEINKTNSVIISDDEISRMARSMQIKNERITNSSYSATIMIDFSPEYVKFILNKYSISKYSPKLDSFLIVPILKDKDNTYFLDKENRWLSVFNRTFANAKNVFVIQNDFATKSVVSIENFSNIDYSSFSRLAKLYNVNNLVIVDSLYIPTQNSINTKIYTISNQRMRKASINYEIENKNNINIDLEAISVKILEYIDSLTDKEVKEDMISKIKLNSDNTILLFVVISSLPDHLNVENILKNNENIFSLDLKMLTKTLSVYQIKYTSDNIENFIKSLKDTGFNVSEKNEGLYLYLNN